MFSRFATRLSAPTRQFARTFSNARPARVNTWGARALGLSAVPLVAYGVYSAQPALSEEAVDYSAVRAAIAGILDVDDYDDGSLGPLLVRLAWHSSGTYSKADGSGGSSGGTMRFSPESDHGANAGLHLARNFLEPIKAAFPGISYADLYTLAGATAIEEMGGPKILWRAGRSDDDNSKNCTPDGRLPDAAQGAGHLRDIFYRMGYNDREIVALSGAHSLGRCHSDRSGFDGPWTNAPTTFSNLYFQELVNNKWTEKQWGGPRQFEDPTGTLMMLPTDIALTQDPDLNKFVELYAQDSEQFEKDFASAFSRMLELGVDFPRNDTSARLLIGSLVALALANGASLLGK